MATIFNITFDLSNPDLDKQRDEKIRKLKQAYKNKLTGAYRKLKNAIKANKDMATINALGEEFNKLSKAEAAEYRAIEDAVNKEYNAARAARANVKSNDSVKNTSTPKSTTTVKSTTTSTPAPAGSQSSNTKKTTKGKSKPSKAATSTTTSNTTATTKGTSAKSAGTQTPNTVQSGSAPKRHAPSPFLFRSSGNTYSFAATPSPIVGATPATTSAPAPSPKRHKPASMLFRTPTSSYSFTNTPSPLVTPSAPPSTKSPLLNSILSAPGGLFSAPPPSSTASVAAPALDPNAYIPVTTRPSRAQFALLTPDEMLNEVRRRAGYVKNSQQYNRLLMRLVELRDRVYAKDVKDEKDLERRRENFKRMAQRVYAYTDIDPKKRVQIRAKTERYLEERNRQIGIGKLGVGTRADLFSEARLAVNAHGGANKTDLFATLDRAERLSERGIGNGANTARRILKQMENRAEGEAAATNAFRLRHKDGYWTYKHPDEWLDYGGKLIEDLRNRRALDNGQAFARWADLHSAYDQIPQKGISRFKDILQSTINDSDRYKSWLSATQREGARIALENIVAGNKPQNYMGVERIVDFRDKKSSRALLEDMRQFAKWIPGGGQYKKSFAAMETRIEAAVTPEAQRQLATDMGQLASRLFTSAKSTPEAHTAYAQALMRRGLEAEADAARRNAQLADVTASRVMNYHYQKQALKRGFGQIGSNLLGPSRLFGILHGTGLHVTETGGRQELWSSLFSSHDNEGRKVTGLRAVPYHFKAIGRQYANGFTGIWRNFTTILSEHKIDLATDLANAVMPILRAGMQMTIGGAITGLVATGALLKGVASYGVSTSDQRTGLRTMYNLSVPKSWKNGRTYEEFEESTYADAQTLRMGSYALQDAILRMALSTAAARHVTGPNIGAPVVTSLEQASRIAKNMALMARITNTSEADLAGIMIQIQQGIGKGKFDIMDIKPMENRSIAFTNMWAREALGLPGGASQLFGLMAEGAGDRTKGITAERAIQGMMDEALTKKLEVLMAGTPRTWEQVGALAADHIKHGAASFLEKTGKSAGKGFGTDILGMTNFIATEKISDTGTLGDVMLAMMPEINDLPALVTNITNTFGNLLTVAGALLEPGVRLGQMFLMVGGVMMTVYLLLESVVAGMLWLVSLIPFKGSAGLHEAAKNSLDSIWENGRVSRSSRMAWVDTGLDAMNKLLETAPVLTNVGGQLSGVKLKSKGFADAEGDDTINTEDSGLTGQVAQIAKDTKDIKKNGAKLTSVQLELLKQVVGRNIVNSVTRVSPNIVANVGTIKSGVEYEQFMADLNKSVRLATMNMAY